MSNILVVTGSARPGRVADKVLPLVQKELKSHDDVSVHVADVKELGLPFFDSEHVPASPEFNPTNTEVVSWAKQISDADGVVFLMPEYNHTMTAIQKNAIDWVYKEWNDKPVAIVGYGWSGGSLAIETAERVFGNVKADVLPTYAKLRFMKELNPDGSVIDEAAVTQLLQATIEELEAAIKK